MIDDLTPSAVKRQCVQGLRRAFEAINPGIPVTEVGAVDCVQDNLILGARTEDICLEFGAGKGNELTAKMRAVHSSSALAVNAFAPLRSAATPLSLCGAHDLSVFAFEAVKPVQNVGGTPPHLDVMLANDTNVFAIESKCTEYLATKTAIFSEAFMKMRDVAALEPWSAEMLRLKEVPEDYRLLDAAQLIKHAFGLACADEARPATLLYLYWEPRDHSFSPLFQQHRQELEKFAERVAGGSPRFAAMTYAQLWETWLESDDPRLRDHGKRLRARYWVPAWAWEGVSFDGETITDAGFHDVD